MMIDNMKICVGEKYRDASFVDIHGESSSIGNFMGKQKCVLFFLRDSACVLTQYVLKNLNSALTNFIACDTYILAVVQSSVQGAKKNLAILDGLKVSDKHFTIICDVNKNLYKLYRNDMAKCEEYLGNDKTMEVISQAKESGCIHGIDEGDKLQLPAVILFDSQGYVTYAYYGRSAEDLPSTTDVLSML